VLFRSNQLTCHLVYESA